MQDLITTKSFLFTFCLSSLLIFSCSSDPDPSCADGILNANETEIDCGGDCPPCETTVAEDQANIQQTFDEVLLCVEMVKDAQGVDVLFREFLMLSDGEVFNEDWLDDLIEELEDVFDFEHIGDNSRVDVPYHSGTYSYNHSNGSWDKTAGNSITFLFPSDPTKTTNNTELSLVKYLDRQVMIDGESMFLPEEFNLLITVDNDRIAEFDFKGIVYDDNADFEIPVSWDASIYFNPITISTTLVRNSTTEFDLDIRIEDGDKCNMTLEVDAELLDDDFENFSNDSFKKMDAKLTVGEMSIQSLAGLGELLSLDDPTDNQINSLLDLNVLFNNVKIADLEYDSELETMVLYYKDSSSEDAKSYWDPFIETLEDLADEFIGD